MRKKDEALFRKEWEQWKKQNRKKIYEQLGMELTEIDMEEHARELLEQIKPLQQQDKEVMKQGTIRQVRSGRYVRHTM